MQCSLIIGRERVGDMGCMIKNKRSIIFIVSAGKHGPERIINPPIQESEYDAGFGCRFSSRHEQRALHRLVGVVLDGTWGWQSQGISFEHVNSCFKLFTEFREFITSVAASCHTALWDPQYP